MNKMKKLVVMPIIAVIVAMLGISVMAASPCSGTWHVHDKNDKDVCEYFQGNEISNPNWDLSKVPGLEAAIKAKGLEIKDLKFKAGYEVHRDTTVEYDLEGRNPHTVYFPVSLAENEYAIVIHNGKNGFAFNICTGPLSEVYISGINDFSPFAIYVGSPTTSPQTGDFAPAYIAMISVALISCGAIFAIRAKKASK